MSSLDPRTPVIVGAGQVTRRPTGPEDLNERVALMAEAATVAAGDAGSERALAGVESVRTVDSLAAEPENSPAAVAAALGLEPRNFMRAAIGGNGPLSLLHGTCAAIGRGELASALLTGAEAFYSRRVARSFGVRAPEPVSPAAPAPEVWGDSTSGVHPAELEIGLALPTQVYPLFSNALARAAGHTYETQRQREAQLWSRFSAVSADNPYAWSQTAFAPEDISEADADNRMIAFPYTKRCCANIQVDQGAAVIVMSAEAAEAAGVSRDRWVFPLAGAEATDHWFVSEREHLHQSPAVRLCWSALHDLAGAEPDDLRLVDLYSCFPSAVQMAAAAIGLPIDDPARPLTLTGGLGFAGGPGNNYSMHSLATAVGQLRGTSGLALVTGVGWFMTKHALTLLSADPPRDGFRSLSVQEQVDSMPKRPLSTVSSRELELETFTVAYDREGEPEKAFVAGLDASGARGWMSSEDRDLMAALVSEPEVALP